MIPSQKSQDFEQLDQTESGAQHVQAFPCVLNLSYSYPDKSKIYQGLTHEFKSAITVIKGRSGSGKTTLLKLLFGALKPTNGVVQTPRRKVFLLQEDALIPWITAFKNIQYFTQIDREILSQQDLISSISELLELKPYQMSYGQRRLVEIVRAMLFRPELMLLDEPFNFLDDHLVEFLIKMILIQAREGTTRFIITTHRHDPDLDFDLCTEHRVLEEKPPYKNLGLNQSRLP